MKLFDIDDFDVFRGMDKTDFLYWKRYGKIKPTENIAYCDFEVLEFCGLLNDKDMEKLCKNYKFNEVNVTRSFDNALGYGEFVIGVKYELVFWLCDKYGTVNVDNLTSDTYGDDWGFVYIDNELFQREKS